MDFMPFPKLLDDRMVYLIALGKAKRLSQSEQIELDKLMALYDEYTILKSKMLEVMKETRKG